MDTVIKIENVSKLYRIGGLNPAYKTLREAVGEAVLSPFRRRANGAAKERDELWALKEVNIEVRQGELVGIVGRNGAGKSTLLKILSRITKPTRGRVTIHGRVGSLLEVGTGFHPDLTGRENVFLSGAILGMRKEEIERKFDEIVAFSEIERFIETPVKHYSSGMYVRLAFSVAAHLEPEILMMDEVLAVGDAAFQQKCLDKMSDIRRDGRTILFVSHNMPAVVRLCRRAVLLHEGRVVADGPAQSVVNEYLSSSWKVRAEQVWDVGEEAPGDETARLRGVRVTNERGETSDVFDIRHPVGIEVTYDLLRPAEHVTPQVELRNEEGVRLFSSHDSGEGARGLSPARYASTVWIPGNLLAEGFVIVFVSLVSHRPSNALHARVKSAVGFQVLDAAGDGAARGEYEGPIPGVVRPLLKWTTRGEGTDVAPRADL